MTEWSKHVHRFAKKHNMSYKQANVSKKCKEAYKKRKTSPRRKTSPKKKRGTRMNNPREDGQREMDEIERRMREITEEHGIIYDSVEKDHLLDRYADLSRQERRYVREESTQ